MPHYASHAFLNSRRLLTLSSWRNLAYEKDALSTAQKNSVSSAKATKDKRRQKVPLWETSTVPISLNIQNPKGVPGYDPDYPLGELLKGAPSVAKDQYKKLKDDLAKAKPRIEKVEMMEDIGLLKQDESRVEFRFDNDDSLKFWHVGCDSVWNEGFSEAELVRTDRNTAVFKGALSSRIVKDGRIERAGWASMKLERKGALNTKQYFTRWKNFTHLLIKCRGDGRSYKLMFHSPLSLDVTWGDSFSHPFHTHGGPYWQFEKIPFSRFFHTVAGRIQDRQYPVNFEDVSSMSIVLMDRIDGPFHLEVELIGICNDRSHVENFGYETYTLPLFYSSGI